MSAKNIILIGPMGSGKSTIGQLVANRLNREFYDSDRYIEQKTGVDIPCIFDIEGESGFRLRETNALKELTLLNNSVLATGGGSVLRSENRKLLQGNSYIIFLDTSVNEQMRRLQRDKKRPLLQTENPRERLENLFSQRKPIYQQLADYTVRTDRCQARKLAAEIAQHIQQQLI